MVAWYGTYLSEHGHQGAVLSGGNINTLVGVCVSQVYAFVKTNQTTEVHFYGWKWCFNFNMSFKRHFKKLSKSRWIIQCKSWDAHAPFEYHLEESVIYVGTSEHRSQGLSTHVCMTIYWPDAIQILYLLLPPYFEEKTKWGSPKVFSTKEIEISHSFGRAF